MMKLTIEDIEKIKSQAEHYISEIIKETEKKTGLVCQGINMYFTEEKYEIDNLKVDLDLRIKHSTENEK